ncbi:COX15/CtaA family protein [Fodinibius sp. Rm-B-1B1-1]|uniref:COX15/CtaA family protein n=1 Tax=Fodinibius alkaliphilus TaxID=3140241 RepID=UPI003159B006
MKFNRYQKVALTTVGATIFLIFVGGLVRASGAGLGCPDWPKCFGMWIPPLTPSDLPARFDASQFNVIKTWTEYINRLIGVIIGGLISITFFLSFKYRKRNPAVFYSSGSAFVMVLIQGWLGGQVVKTGLSEWLITLHMILAMLIMITLVYAVFKASKKDLTVEIPLKMNRILAGTLIVLMVSTFVQLILGTQVREVIDVLKNMTNAPPRETWIAQVGLIDEIHRSFSWIVLAAGGVLYYLTSWKLNSSLLQKLGIIVLALIGLQVLTGIGMYYLNLPPVYQVIHLTGIAFLIAAETLALLIVANANPQFPEEQRVE